HLTIGWDHRTKDIARFAAPAIVDGLPGSARWLGFRRFGIHQLLTWIAFDPLGPHFIQTHGYTSFWRSGVESGDGSPFSGEVGINPLAKPAFFVPPAESFGDEELADATALHPNAFDSMQVVHQAVQRPSRKVLSQITGMGESRLNDLADDLWLVGHRTPRPRRF